MQVREVMGPVVGSARADDLLRDASEKMRSLGIDPLPVTSGGRVIGMLTRDQIMKRLQRDGISAGLSRVGDAMDKNVVCCFEDQDVAEAVKAIEAHPTVAAADRVPVIDREGRFVGIASLRNLRRRENEPEDGTTGVQAVSSVDELVNFEDDTVDYMSDASFPASDPPQTSPRGDPAEEGRGPPK
jgi:CBS domain-containing protein